MATLLLFAQAKEAAGTRSIVVDETHQTVGDVLDHACATFGQAFADVLDFCRVWRNGEPANRGEKVGANDEIAVLPPVSGG